MAVPNNYTFSFLTVKTELGTSSNTLTGLFAAAVSGGFDPAYSGSKNSLRNFRNYSHVQFNFTRLKKSSSSSAVCSGAYLNFYLDGTTLLNSTKLYNNSAGTSTGAASWYSDGSKKRYWNGITFGSSSNC